MLLLVAATVTVLFTYFHLNAEDHRWWWRSFSSGGAVELLVLLLQFLHLGIKSLLSLLTFCFLFLDLCIQVRGGHLHVLLNLRLLLIVAEVNVLGAAHGLQVLLCECFQFIEISATLVVLEGAWVTPLDGWETLYAMLLTQWLSICGAINIGNESASMTLELLH